MGGNFIFCIDPFNLFPPILMRAKFAAKTEIEFELSNLLLFYNLEENLELIYLFFFLLLHLTRVFFGFCAWEIHY